MSTTAEDSLRIGQKRLTQVFRYLEALNNHRSSAKRYIDEQIWKLWLRDLPDHPSIQRATPAEIRESGGISRQERSAAEALLRVRRPKLSQCPRPPEPLLPWLETGWQELTSGVQVRPWRFELRAGGHAVVVHFEDDPERSSILRCWQVQRDAWAAVEKPAYDAARVFERLYEVWGRIEKEGERIELVLGDGILSWRRDNDGIHHPILLQRVQLEFDPTIPEFSIVESERPVELYSALFQHMTDVDGKVLARLRHELEEGGFHLLGQEDTSGLLRSLVIQLSSRGEFHAESAPKALGQDQVLCRAPVIFLRNRDLGYQTNESVSRDVEAELQAILPDAAKSKESKAATMLAAARWDKMPDGEERSKLMRKVRAARSNAPGGRNGGRKRLEDRCYCGERSWKTGVTRRFDCCKRAGKYPKGGGA
jgi:hypothetical protein